MHHVEQWPMAILSVVSAIATDTLDSFVSANLVEKAWQPAHVLVQPDEQRPTRFQRRVVLLPVARSIIRLAGAFIRAVYLTASSAHYDRDLCNKAYVHPQRPGSAASQGERDLRPPTLKACAFAPHHICRSFLTTTNTYF